MPTEENTEMPILSSLDVANALLGCLQNISDEEDAKEFVRIYLDSLEAAGEQIDRDEIVKHVSDGDFRFKCLVVVDRKEITKFYPKGGLAYVGRDTCKDMEKGGLWAELIIRNKC